MSEKKVTDEELSAIVRDVRAEGDYTFHRIQDGYADGVPRAVFIDSEGEPIGIPLKHAGPLMLLVGRLAADLREARSKGKILGPCAYCGAESQGNYSIHRDGFGEGPEVPLCDEHGGKPEPTEAEIWARIQERAETLRLFAVDDEEFVIAKSPDDARAVLRDLKYDEPADGWSIEARPDNEPFTFCEDNDEKSAKTKTAREWCAERGRGYFCAATGVS